MGFGGWGEWGLGLRVRSWGWVLVYRRVGFVFSFYNILYLELWCLAVVSFIVVTFNKGTIIFNFGYIVVGEFWLSLVFIFILLFIGI